MGYVSRQQKAVSVAKEPGGEYVPPTNDNVISGNYPISRPLLVYTNGKPQGVVKRFMDFILSSEGQKLVEENDFVPILPLEALPPSARPMAFMNAGRDRLAFSSEGKAAIRR
jgi:ABC-type phosphate transport system substrate-binding protein